MKTAWSVNLQARESNSGVVSFFAALGHMDDRVMSMGGGSVKAGLPPVRSGELGSGTSTDATRFAMSPLDP